MIGHVFRDALSRQIEALPIFLRPQLAPILGLLFDWVDASEARLELIEGQLRALNKMPSAASLEGLIWPSPAALMPPIERQCTCAAQIEAGPPRARKQFICAVHGIKICQECDP